MQLQPYATPADQAWLRLWISLYGPGSRLSRYALPHLPRVAPKPIPRPLSPQKAQARPRRPKITRSPQERTERRIARDIERTTRLPTSDWAKRIVGDERYRNVTLQDIIEGIEDYFEIFGRMRKVAPDAYAYFSRVGAPIITSNHGIWDSTLNALTVANPSALPSYFGAFWTSTKKDYRQNIIDDKPTGAEFHLFEKPKNAVTAAMLGTTVFRHSEIFLKRDAFSKEELKQYPCARDDFSIWWYLGVQPDGQVRALPCRMSHWQKLPSGDTVHHSGFEIPQGLYEWAKSKGQRTPHDMVRLLFNGAMAFTAASTSGITVTIRKGKQAARLGLPIGALKGFFADRDSVGRRSAIMHLRLGHDRHMKDGRVVQVGEHLRGTRFFQWRGYDITVGVPGIHFPSPEGLNEDLWVQSEEEKLPPELEREQLLSMSDLGARIERVMSRRRNVPIRHGEPSTTYIVDTLPPAPNYNLSRSASRDLWLR